MDKDPLDIDLALERLGVALPLQLRSAVAYTTAAGALTGFQYLGLSDLLWRFAEAELTDVRHLVEKIVTLGGTPADHVTGFGMPPEPEETAVLARAEAEREEADAEHQRDLHADAGERPQDRLEHAAAESRPRSEYGRHHERGDQR